MVEHWWIVSLVEQDFPSCHSGDEDDGDDGGCDAGAAGVEDDRHGDMVA